MNEHEVPNGGAGGPVALFVTCVGELVDPDVPVAAVRLLRRCGASVSVPEGQTCCGQPAWNAGFAAEAAAVARTSLNALDRTSGDVVVPAGSCATMVKLYWPALFDTVGDPVSAAAARRLAPRVHELTEWVAPRLPASPASSSSPEREPVAYHRSCHMERELHVQDQPRSLLVGAGCPVAEWDADDRCCGFGGTFSVRLPEVSAAMADDKLDTLPEGVTEIVGADASCLLQLRTRAEQRGLPVRTRHIAQVLTDER